MIIGDKKNSLLPKIAWFKLPKEIVDTDDIKHNS